MKRSLGTWLLLVILLCLPAPAVTATAPDCLLIRGFWFADGFLLAEPGLMDWHVVAKTPVKLLAQPDLSAPVLAELPSGARAKIEEIAFAACPGRQIIRANMAIASQDGKISLQANDEIKLVCYQGDAVAAYVGEDMVLVDLYGLKLGDQIRPEWRENMGGLQQWLKLVDSDGQSGWTQFFDPVSKRASGRWQHQPKAVGGSHNFNVIVFSEEMPHFQRLPLLTRE